MPIPINSSTFCHNSALAASIKANFIIPSEISKKLYLIVVVLRFFKNKINAPQALVHAKRCSISLARSLNSRFNCLSSAYNARTSEFILHPVMLGAIV